MTIYTKSIRNNQACYTKHEGMTSETIKKLMLEIGHIDIKFITENVYTASTGEISNGTIEITG